MNLIERAVIRRHLQKKLNDDGLTPAARKGIETVLRRPLKMIQLNDAIDSLAADNLDAKTLTAIEGNVNQIGDGKILEQLLAFLSDHWEEILALILKLLGL